MASRTWPFSLRRRLLLRVSIALVASPLLILAAAFEVRHLPGFVAAVILVPVLLAATTAAATALGRRGAPAAAPPWPDLKLVKRAGVGAKMGYVVFVGFMALIALGIILILIGTIFASAT